MNKITFNKPYLTGKETHYVSEAIQSLRLSGNGIFTKKCQQFLSEKYEFKKCLLTTSCTDALEMAALLIGIKAGDEVIMPAYTFVSTANPFVLRGAKIIFADSLPNHPNIDASKIEKLITSKTKVIVPVHYAGMACDMETIMNLANKYNLFVIEDASQAIDSFYKGKPLGGIGHFGTFSFHETKNIIAGEGGALVVNDADFIAKSEIIWEKGTNRAAFFRGEINKYEWVDIGSSFLPAEVVSAFLYAQLEGLDYIQEKRKCIWENYYKGLLPLEEKGLLKLPKIPNESTNNAHIFYLICNSNSERDGLIQFLKENDVQSVFHYLSLHNSVFYKQKHDGRVLKNADNFERNLIRIPLYPDLTDEQVEYIVSMIINFYQNSSTK